MEKKKVDSFINIIILLKVICLYKYSKCLAGKVDRKAFNLFVILVSMMLIIGLRCDVNDLELAKLRRSKHVFRSCLQIVFNEMKQKGWTCWR